MLYAVIEINLTKWKNPHFAGLHYKFTAHNYLRWATSRNFGYGSFSLLSEETAFC